MKHGKDGFNLMEMMICVMIIGLLASMAMPNYMDSRERTQLNICTNNLRQINSAKVIMSVDQGMGVGDSFTDAALLVYMRGDVSCPETGEYYFNNIGTSPTCTLGATRGHVFVE